MRNEVLFFLALLLDYSLLASLYRWMGKTGLYLWVAIATILANIQVLKVVPLFGMTATLGNVAYATIYLATDILSENHSKKDALTAVKLGFATSLTTILLMTLTLLFQPATEDFAHEHLKAIFGILPRVTIASFCAYAISQVFDVLCYHYWKDRLPSRRWLWVRNNVSALCSQAIDTLVFVTIAFYGCFPADTFWSIVITTYGFKAIATVADTPCLYLLTRQRHQVPQKTIQE